MKRRTLLFLVLGSIAGVGLLAWGTWHCLDFMATSKVADASAWDSRTWPELLVLNEEQHSTIKPMERGLQKEMDRLDAELAKKQILLCQGLMSDEANPRGMTEIQREITSLRTQRDERMLAHLMTVRGVLTADQRSTLFTTLMRDICRGCRAGTGEMTDHCGYCDLKEAE